MVPHVTSGAVIVKPSSRSNTNINVMTAKNQGGSGVNLGNLASSTRANGYGLTQTNKTASMITRQDSLASKEGMSIKTGGVNNSGFAEATQKSDYY